MISATVVADSKHPQTGKRLISIECVFNRYILAEVNTHCMLTKNSASSRAIPIQANIENIIRNTGKPVSWGKNQSGMVADLDVDENTARLAEESWIRARDNAIKEALYLSELGIHKQIANRLIENFTYQKALISGTEWDNLLWLRAEKSAQPEFQNLAFKILDAINESNPTTLQIGEWHLPYINTYRDNYDVLHYLDVGGNDLSIENARKISASCAAQISYRKNDDSLEKALRVFDMLNLTDESGETRKHSSPVGHIGTPIDYSKGIICSDLSGGWNWDDGVTHIDKNGNLWSANFQDFIQYRHLIPNESCKKHPDIIEK